MKAIDYRKISARLLVTLGGIAILGGGLDPMEGAPAILIGSGLFALGTFLSRSERRLVAYRVGMLILIAIGVCAMWTLSAAGGFGGRGRSMWWGALLLPYLIGWSMEIWGAGSPRWLVWLGIVAGLWYVTIAVICETYSNAGVTADSGAITGTMAGTGLLTIGGCVWNLTRRKSWRARGSNAAPT